MWVIAANWGAALQQWKALIALENDGDGAEPDGIMHVCDDDEILIYGKLPYTTEPIPVHDIGEFHSDPAAVGVKQGKSDLACTECPHVFTEAEIAAEDKAAWGHPCHVNTDNPEPPTACESFRKPLNEETESERVLRRRRAVMPDYDKKLLEWLS
jgi:hypothetical protein